MPEANATLDDNETPDTEGTPETASPEQTGSDESAMVASARKRQAGAEAARKVAEDKLRAADKELAKYRAEHQTAEQSELTEIARLTARAEAAEKAAAEADAKAEARILDAKFPAARAEYPEVSDEAKLAKLEVLLGDDSAETPTPRKPTTGREGNSSSTPAKPKTSEDLVREMTHGPLPEWLRPR